MVAHLVASLVVHLEVSLVELLVASLVQARRVTGPTVEEVTKLLSFLVLHFAFAHASSYELT